jgi:hypothetical protein
VEEDSRCQIQHKKPKYSLLSGYTPLYLLERCYVGSRRCKFGYKWLVGDGKAIKF